MAYLFKSFKNRYVILIATVIGLIIINQIIVQYSISQQNTDALIINVSGKQRLLSQQISKNAHLLYFKNDTSSEAIENIKLLSLEIKGNQKFLIDENQDRKNRTIDSLLTVGNLYLQEILTNSAAINAHPDSTILERHFYKLNAAEYPFLSTMETLVSIYQHEAEARVKQLKEIEILLSVIAIFVLILEYIFIILPVLKKNKDLTNLNSELAESQTELKKTKANLEYREIFNKIFIEQAPNAIAMYDHKMRLMAASQQWLLDNKLVGKDLIGRTYYQIFTDESAYLKPIHQECLEGATNKTDELNYTDSQGNSRWVKWDIRPWHISTGHIGGLLVYTEDITEKKQQEKEKQRIEEILDKTNDVARIGTWEVDTVNGTVTWSRVTKEIHEVPTNYQPDLDTGINFFKEGPSRDKISKAVTEAIEHGTPYDVELELVTAKGNVVWARAIGQSEHIDGKCIRLYGVFQDINEKKLSQRALDKGNAEMKAILNAGPISIISTDKNGLITHFNKGAEKLLQYTADEMIGINTPAILHVQDEVVQRGDELSNRYNREIRGFDVFTEYANQGTFESRKWTYVRKDGSTYPVQLIVSPLEDGHGQITGYLGVGTDISEMVEKEAKLLESKTNLEILSNRLTHQNKQLASFAHITSHNLRSPISNLNSLLNLYHLSEEAEDKQLLFEKFELVIDHLSNTLNTLVESLKIREDNENLSETLYFDETLMKVSEMISEKIKEAGVEIESDFSAAPKIKYNESYLESIMLNLITNALKYRAPDRKTEITLKTEMSNRQVKLIVTDNGLGIDLEKHGEKLFGLNKTFHRHSEAKGVGLYITKTQIDSMGGTISAESEVNEGSIFTVNF